MLATYPGLAYWGGLPYFYAIIVPASLWDFMVLVQLSQPQTPALLLGTLSLGYGAGGAWRRCWP